MGLRIKNFNFNIMGVLLKNPILKGQGVHENPIHRGELPRKGGLDSL